MQRSRLPKLLRRWYRTNRGMRYQRYGNLEYLLKVPKSWNRHTGPRPVVFWHGLGLGMFQYAGTLTNLMDVFPDRPLLVPIQPSISQDIFHPQFLTPMSRQETVKSVTGLLAELGWVSPSQIHGSDTETDANEPSPIPSRGVTMMSHSNGSYAHAWMLKDHANLVKSSCFVDPVAFCGWEGDVCYNFIYRPCMTGIELIMRYFVSMELGTANLLQRHFDWSSNSLFFEEIPNARDEQKTLYVLGGKDDIVASHRVERYLNSHGASKCLFYAEDALHGQSLIDGQPGHGKIIEWLREQQ